MISRRDLLCAGALAPVATSSFAAAQTYTAGKEYLTVTPQAPTSAAKIEVVEFFAYTCPHCLQFQPIFHSWAEHAPSDVTVRVCPVAWQPKYLPFTETYFALEALGLLDKVSLPFFESVIYQTHSYNFESAASDIRAFMETQGIDGEKWTKTVNSFGVKIDRAVALHGAPPIDRLAHQLADNNLAVFYVIYIFLPWLHKLSNRLNWSGSPPPTLSITLRLRVVRPSSFISASTC